MTKRAKVIDRSALISEDHLADAIIAYHNTIVAPVFVALTARIAALEREPAATLVPEFVGEGVPEAEVIPLPLTPEPEPEIPAHEEAA